MGVVVGFIDDWANISPDSNGVVKSKSSIFGYKRLDLNIIEIQYIPRFKLYIFCKLAIVVRVALRGSKRLFAWPHQPKPMLTNHSWSSMAFAWEKFRSECLNIIFCVVSFMIILLELLLHPPGHNGLIISLAGILVFPWLNFQRGLVI